MSSDGAGSSGRVLLIQSGAVSAGLVEAAELASKAATVVTVEGFEGLAGQSGPFDMVISAAVRPHTGDFLAHVLRMLKPSGTLVLFELVVPSGMSHEAVRNVDALSTAFLMGGLIDSKVQQVTPQPDVSSLSPPTGAFVVKIVARKPDWEVGTVQSLNFRRKAAAPVSKPATGTMSVQDALSQQGNLELIDDDTLLDPADLANKGKPRAECAPTNGPRKTACKNCTCGLAEQLAAVDNSPEISAQPKSACGSCYLGDAFRCAGCPYRGLPPFQPGEKVSLAAMDLGAVDL